MDNSTPIPTPPVRSARTTPPGSAGNLAAAHYIATEMARLAPPPEESASRWTPAMEKLARHAMKKAARLAWQFEAIADAARRLNDRLSIVSGVLGAFVGTGGLVGAATPVSATPAIGLGSASWPTVVSIVIGYTISIIAVLVTNWRLSEIQSKGVTAQVGLLNTAREIRWQLAQPVADRADAYEFVYAREAEIAHILAAAPPREDWVRERFAARASLVGDRGGLGDEDGFDDTPLASPRGGAQTPPRDMPRPTTPPRIAIDVQPLAQLANVNVGDLLQGATNFVAAEAPRANHLFSMLKGALDAARIPKND